MVFLSHIYRNRLFRPIKSTEHVEKPALLFQIDSITRSNYIVKSQSVYLASLVSWNEPTLQVGGKNLFWVCLWSKSASLLSQPGSLIKPLCISSPYFLAINKSPHKNLCHFTKAEKINITSVLIKTRWHRNHFNTCKFYKKQWFFLQ